MKIWIDLTDFLNWRGNLTGIQRIQYNISKLYRESGKDVHFFVYRESRRDFREIEFDPDEIVKSGIISIGVSSNSRLSRYMQRAINKISSNKNTIKKKCELFSKDDVVLIMGGMWAGDYMNDLADCKKAIGFKLVHFAFDMIPSLFPGYVVDWLPDCFNSYFKTVYSISEGILSISESTANDAREFMKIHGIKKEPLIKIVRIGEGISSVEKNTKEKSLKHITGDDFILSVSTIEGRKNHASFFYVIKEAKLRGIKIPKIVIVGRNGWLTDDIRYMIKKDPDAKENIVLLNEVDDNELDWLYKNCLFTVFPSFYEGWGMPVAESLAYGKLCLSSDTSSMPEIAADLIDYFSPYDTGAALERIVEYLDPLKLKKKEAEIASKYHQTSWRDMFLNVDDFVSKIIRA